jgi:hypothetical protein
MAPGFPVIVEVEDTPAIETSVHAVPQIGATLRLRGKGTLKVKEVEFSDTAEGEPLRITLRCVPILSF